MSIIIKCALCGRSYNVADSAAGKKAKCTACGAVIPVPVQTLDVEPMQPPVPPVEPPLERPAAAPADMPKKMMANKLYAGKTCPVCRQMIDLGQSIRNCELCASTHHDACWQTHGGCGTPSCGNAPLPKLAAKEGEAPLPGIAALRNRDAMRPCPFCGEKIAAAAASCRYCGQFVAGAGTHPQMMMQPQQNSGNAIAALVLGILSIVTCYVGFILGIIAIALAGSARRQMAMSRGRIGGQGMATAGRITGIVGLTLWSVILLIIVIAAIAGS